MPLYRIKDWDTIYETAETRKLENLRWTPVPNKHDGLGFRRVVAQRDRCELLAAWVLIVQVASKGRRGDRGALVRDGQAMGAEDLALVTGFPAQIFERALTFFSDPKQGWLLMERNGDISANTASASEQSAGSPVAPASSPGRPAESPAVWNGIEEKSKEGKGRAAAKPLGVEPEQDIPLPNVLLTEAFKAKWAEYIAYRRKRHLPTLMPDTIRRQWNKLASYGHDGAIASIDQTLENQWQGLFAPKEGAKPGEAAAPVRFALS